MGDRGAVGPALDPGDALAEPEREPEAAQVVLERLDDSVVACGMGAHRDHFRHQALIRRTRVRFRNG